KIAVGSDGDQKLVGKLLVNFKLIIRGEEFTNGDLRIVADIPRSILEISLRHVLDDGVKNREIAAGAHERCVRSQFVRYVLMRVVRIENDHDATMPISESSHLADDIIVNR